MESKLTIGITDCSSFGNYRKWIEREEGVEVIRLASEQGNLDDTGKCHGIILSGGEDVDPGLYNRAEYRALCEEVNERRDEFEWKVLEHTQQHHIPVLGICRGLQVANVFFGGTLIPHIPAFGKFGHARNGSTDKYHEIKVDRNSLLKEIVGITDGEVNSAHHQSADQIGRGLVCNVISPDGVVEGLEREERSAGPFLLLVQWHPERMTDQESVYSKRIKAAFLDAARKH